MEQRGETVDVHTLGGGLFDAEVHLIGGGSTWLRVALLLETGPRLRMDVHPLHP
jgi:hypothetical protein